LWSLRAGAKDEEASNADRNKLIRELVAEFIGTFILIQLGSGSVMSDIFDGAFSGLFQVAACWAIAVTIAISTTSSISGAHLNPSISFAFALLRGFQWSKVVPYALAQTMGAIAASSVNLILFSSKIAAFEKANGIVRGTAASVASARAFGEYFS
jgi:glycerol uptake facilitator-like aquaporin